MQFLFFAFTIPAKFFGEDVDHLGEGVEGGLCVEEGETGATGDDVCGFLSVFVACGVTDFAIDNCEQEKFQSECTTTTAEKGLHGYSSARRTP